MTLREFLEIYTGKTRLLISGTITKIQNMGGLSPRTYKIPISSTPLFEMEKRPNETILAFMGGYEIVKIVGSENMIELYLELFAEDDKNIIAFPTLN